MADTVISLTTGQPGAGKSYTATRFLVDDFLQNDIGLYITNIPIIPEVIAAHLAKKTGKPESEYLARMILISKEELDSWEGLASVDKNILRKMREKREFPPALFFDRYDLTNARIVIDEFHIYFKKSHPVQLRDMWNDWFAEIRKLGCTFEALTQDLSQIPREFIGKVGARVDMIPVSATRDPFLFISMGDWYELFLGYTDSVEPKISVTEYRKGTSFTGAVKWVKSNSWKYTLDPLYFTFYRSLQRNDNLRTGNKIPPHKRYGKRVWIWFVKRNFWALLSRLLIVIFFFWLTFGGGLLFLINSFITTITKMGAANAGSAKVVQSNKPLASGGQGNVARAGDADQEKKEKERQFRKDQFKPSMFFDGFCWLRNGIKIHIGYKFKEEPYNEKTVKEINGIERFYCLDDGTIVYMY